jgi:molecular chaperone GrpE
MGSKQFLQLMEKEFQENGAATDNSSFNAAGADLNTDENMAGTNHLNENVADDSQVQKLQDEVAEQKDKYLRLIAEFDNFKRRTAKERIELTQTAGKEIVVSMLDVLDDADRAEKVITTSNDPAVIKEGVQLVFNKLRSILQSKGLKAMESVGKEFDTDQHEAITEVPVPGQEGKVIDEVTKGYLLNDKLIRFAKVVVGK